MYLDGKGIWKWKYSTEAIQATGYEDFIKSTIFMRPEEFKSLSPEGQAMYVNRILHLIRKINVYPIYYFNNIGVRDEITKCLLYNVDPFEHEVTEKSSTGKVLLDFMFPNLHLAEAGSTTGNNMYSRFYDDTKLTRCIAHHAGRHAFTNLRTVLFMHGRYFWPTPTNFSPMRARSICERFCKPNGVIYDFASGFGGRMLGILTSSKCYTYIGCEPNKNTFYNLNRLGSIIEQVTGKHNSYILHNACSEELIVNENSVDFAFSCPPYYGLERYSRENTQSFIRYPEYSDWLSNYVYPTLKNVYVSLKNGCRLGYVIAKVINFCGNKYYLGADWARLATEVGFTFEREYTIKSRVRKNNEETEVLYVFRKEE